MLFFHTELLTEKVYDFGSANNNFIIYVVLQKKNLFSYTIFYFIYRLRILH